MATTAQANDTTLCVALELSRSTWLVGINLPGSDKVSKHAVPGGDGAALLGVHPGSLRIFTVRQGLSG